MTTLRTRGHNYVLPKFKHQPARKSFVNRSLLSHLYKFYKLLRAIFLEQAFAAERIYLCLKRFRPTFHTVLHRSYDLGTLCMPAGRMFVRPIVCSFVRASVRLSFTRRTIMHRERTAVPAGANFYALMQIDTVLSPANFHPKRQRTSLSF